MIDLPNDMDEDSLKEGFYFDKFNLVIEYLLSSKGPIDGFASSLNSYGLHHPNNNHIKKNWVMIPDPKNYLEFMRADLNWMEQKLSQLEQQSLSAQSQPKSTPEDNERQLFASRSQLVMEMVIEQSETGKQ
jgi:hypothetical protein